MITQRILDRAFEALIIAAIAGTRCPTNKELHANGEVVAALARAGQVKIEISFHNWRRVTILTGPHKGKATQADPSGHTPWLVIDGVGRRKVQTERQRSRGLMHRSAPAQVAIAS